MSCFGPVSVGRSPVPVRPTTDAVSGHSCGLCYCCLSSACVQVPDLREVVLRTRLPRGGRLRVSRCGLMARAAFPRGSGTFSCPVLSRKPRSRCWFRMLLTIKAHGPYGCLDPTLEKLFGSERVVERGVASTSPQLVVGYATCWADASRGRRAFWPAQLRQPARLLSACKGGRLPTLDVKEDVLPG